MNWFLIFLLNISGPDNNNLLRLNYLRFYPTDTISYVSVEYSIDVSQFRPKRKTVNLPLKIEVKIIPEYDKEIIEDNWEKKVPVNPSSSHTLDILGFLLTPGNYKVTLSFELKNKRIEEEFPIQIESISGPALSDVELTTLLSRDTLKTPFRRGTFSFLPSPDLSFAYPDTYLHYYYEIYNPPEVFFLNYALMDISGKTILNEEKKDFANRNSSVFTYGTIPLNLLKGGNYRFRVTLLDSNRTPLFRRETSFNWISQMELQKRWATEKLEDYMSFIDYIATSSELAEFKKIKGKARKAFLKKFWKRHDPDPETPVNEFFAEFIERVRYTDANYKAQNKKGRFTDRGRILIKYGAPFEARMGPYPLGGHSWESWIYTEPKPMQFIFVDINDNNEYELIYSSEPTEPGRTNWQNIIPPEEIEIFR